MNREYSAEDRESEAVSWFVRLRESDDEATWLAHRDWLESDPSNRAAFARVDRLWVEADDLADLSRSTPETADSPIHEDGADVIDLDAWRAARPERRKLRWLSAAAAAAAAAMLIGPQVGRLLDDPGVVYHTDATHGLEVALDDGSRLTLDRSTDLTVRLTGERRSVALASGQAAFDVRHDATRPFVIRALGREVQVLGTEFDVMARDGAFGVSVRRGLVSVSDEAARGGTVRLPAGKGLLRLPGSDADRIDDVGTGNALAWKAGRLVYLDSTLATMAHDYERYIGLPVTVAPAARDLHISGVVKVRDEADLIRQLELLLPIRVVKTAGGREIRKR